MKIVIVAQWIYPYNTPRAFRSTELAKEFARCGHNVILYGLLGNYDYSDFTRNTGVVVKGIGKSKFGNFNSSGVRNTNLAYRIFGKIFGPLTEFPNIELMHLVSKTIRYEKSIDLLISVAYPFPIHWGISYVQSKFNQHKQIFKTWISDCGDPFMGNPMLHHAFYFKYIEKWWCRKTDYITIPVESAVSAYYKEFRHKIRIIPQGFDFSNIKLAEYKKNAVPTFAYAGQIYPGKRDPTLFLEYLKNVKDDFKFIVYTKQRHFFDKYMDKLEHKIDIRDFVSRDKLLIELSKMDFLINIKNDSAVQTPSKLIDYFIVKRPITTISSRFLLQEKRVFNNFIMGNYVDAIPLIDLKQYDIKNVAQQFIELFNLK